MRNRNLTLLSLALFALSGCLSNPTDEATTDVAGSELVAPVGPFFAAKGTNNRTCETCHREQNAWSITPAFAQGLPITSPLFAFDGSDCLAAGVLNNSTNNSSEMMGYGNTRVELAIPGGADFTLAGFTDPKRCATAPSASLIRVYRRPLPSANAAFITNVMWDGRENTANTLFDNLKHQANSATLGHEQAASSLSDADQSNIATFETTLFHAPTTANGVTLNAGGANGGPDYLKNVVLPAYKPGANDPLQPGFNRRVFTIYGVWEPGPGAPPPPSAAAAAIGRGEAIFNNRGFTIANVAGLNGPNDGRGPIGGTCSTCHNNPNVGNHTVARFLDQGIALAPAPAPLDAAHLPTYRLVQSGTGLQRTVTDPGRALVTGRFADVGKFKTPSLRGLGARAPYFHNGSAANLGAVVDFYNRRFNIGLTPQERSDLIAFLAAL